MSTTENTGTTNSASQTPTLVDKKRPTAAAPPPWAERRVVRAWNQHLPVAGKCDCPPPRRQASSARRGWREIVKGAQGMIAKRKLPYVIKKERNGAGEITLGLYPAAKR